MKQLAEQSKRPSKLPSLPPSLHRSILESIKSAANSSQHLQTRDTESIETIWRKKGRGRRTRDCKETAGESKHGKRGKSGQKSSEKTLYIYIKEKYRKERKNSERLLIKAFPLVSTSPVESLPRRLYPVQTETRYYLDSPESNRRDTSRSYV